VPLAAARLPGPASPEDDAAAKRPDLWLEIRPRRAFAAQPRIDASAINLTLGLEAETRVVSQPTTPECPFPATLDLAAQMEQGRASIALPIDVPFAEINRVLARQLVGRTFPEDKNGPGEFAIASAIMAPSGDRLLLSLRLKTKDNSWFSFANEAGLHIWVRPVLDREQQVLRLTDIVADVESEAAFGLLGAAARAVVPFLVAALGERAVIDLKPLAANARKAAETALADLRSRTDGVTVEAAITDLRLTGIAFDASTLRVTAEADGTVKVAVTALPTK
jgi:hypothetical protein